MIGSLRFERAWSGWPRLMVPSCVRSFLYQSNEYLSDLV